MAGRIPREFIDDLLTRVDIVDLIDPLVPLKKSGANFMARCPFHTEKTPSFSVNRNKQFFHCFGCGASGNAIGFLMDFNHLDFVEAVEDLAAFIGLEVPREQGQVTNSSAPKKAVLDDSYDLLMKVAKFYSQQFKHNAESYKAIEYLKSREVEGRVAKDFLLGYAPDSWQTLGAHFDQESLITAGLLIKKADRSYDRFRGRVMFPIRDRRGRVVGFGGRVLDDSVPKYLNSPETQIFQKGREVYGLYEALEKNNKLKRLLIVEGYMDVIALSQYEIHYAVAVLGTAISPQHFELLFRVAPELVFCFDGDLAGRQAAWRTVETGLPYLRDGRQVNFMLMPEGEDPDSLIRSMGVDVFLKMQDEALPLSDYFFDSLSEGRDLLSIEGRAGLVQTAKKYIEKLPNGFYQDMMLDRLKKTSKVDYLDIFDNSIKNYEDKKVGRPTGKTRNSPARTVIILLLQNPGLSKIAIENQSEWEVMDSQAINLFKAIIKKISRSKNPSLASIVESFRGAIEEKYVNKLAAQSLHIPTEGIENEFTDSLKRMIQRGREELLEQLIAKEKSYGLDDREKQLLLKMLIK